MIIVLPTTNTSNSSIIIRMTETILISHLFALGVISLMLNSFLLFPLAGLNITVAAIYASYISTDQSISIIAIITYTGFLLFSIVFAIVTLIGSVLGFMYQDHVRKIGLKMLIATNTILFIFLLANIVVMIAGFTIAGLTNASLFLPAAIAPVICICQCGLFGYGSFYIGMICKSFDWKSDNRKPA